MQIFPGSQALSDFRRDKLLSQLKAGGVTDIRGWYVHFVDADGLNADDDAKLQDLLGEAGTLPNEGELFLVVPRPGTISPWSSKATDIAHNSGLEAVKRIERGIAYYVSGTAGRNSVTPLLHDRMTEAVLDNLDAAQALFSATEPKHMTTVDILGGGPTALEKANLELGLALADDEIEYLLNAYKELERNPTDVELMMFGVVNSEHCRHKIFNADWVIDGEKQPKSLFKMIKNTYEKGGQEVLSAYSDNAAVIEGPKAGRFFADPVDNTYRYHKEAIHTVIKVETHNHPTAIAPFPGAATGSGGEIRDEAATGRGAKSKMGLAGYTVSNLQIPEATQPWEKPYGKPDRIVSALDIMLEAPIGAASFVNEFGRPNLGGYFRTYEQEVNGEVLGYHKPIMIAGGLGNIRAEHVKKNTLPVGAKLIVLGGPAMLIGLGGGAASSMQTGSSHEDLDFASVQRGNGEMERRAQEVIDRCWAMGVQNPIIAIHDVGAGGLSNAFPELVHDSDRGAIFQLRDIPSAEPGLSPLEIWCNEAQERYVLGVAPADVEAFMEICERERCPFAIVGETTEDEVLVVHDDLFANNPVDVPMEVLFGKPPKMTRTVTRQQTTLPSLQTDQIDVADAVKRVLHLPAVGSKKFLITIGDRTVGGLIARDQMVGPWQVPVSDVAVAARSFESDTGEAMTMGERTPLAVINAPASARIAIGEAITNIVAADVAEVEDIKLSANWMAAAGTGQEDERLYDTVKAVGEEFCPAVGLTIPVGKDSLSMRTKWDEEDTSKSVTSPVSLIISAFSPVWDVHRTLTPQLSAKERTVLLLIDLGQGKNRLGGSALAQVYNKTGNETPDIDAEVLKGFFKAITKLKQENKILAYHDRSDGGLLATISEMAFASRCGLEINLRNLMGKDTTEKLFNEELGAVIQINIDDYVDVQKLFTKHIGKNSCHVIGKSTEVQDIVIKDGDDDKEVFRSTRAELETWWSDTSYQIQKLRDNPQAANEEYAAIQDNSDPGLSAVVPFELSTTMYKTQPKVAICREEGVNGHVEMAAAMDRAGFTSVDVHLNDIKDGKVDLNDFVGLVACGGFSYGDVLGSGQGWAKSILFHDDLRAKFKAFFERPDTFSLGVCNGCQMLSALKELIPGAESWPAFVKNKSEQFEARVPFVQITQSPSIFFQDMAGAFLPIPIAHGEGYAQFATEADAQKAVDDNLVAMQFVDHYMKPATTYPFNPNGSPKGITSLTTPDGRATILMPHPERAFLTRQLSWHPDDWAEESPWFKMFQNARFWIEDTDKN